MLKRLFALLFGEPPHVNETSDDNLEFELIANPLSRTSKEIARNGYLLTKAQREFVAEQRAATYAVKVATIVIAGSTLIYTIFTVLNYFKPPQEYVIKIQSEQPLRR